MVLVGPFEWIWRHPDIYYKLRFNWTYSGSKFYAFHFEINKYIALEKERKYSNKNHKNDIDNEFAFRICLFTCAINFLSTGIFRNFNNLRATAV